MPTDIQRAINDLDYAKIKIQKICEELRKDYHNNDKRIIEPLRRLEKIVKEVVSISKLLKRIFP